jgi:hypothetical protein
VSKLREIRNYFFLRKAVRKASASPEWKKYKLRVNWFGVIYTTLSLREEDMGDDESVKRFKIIMMMQPINEYVASIGSEDGGLGIRELVMPRVEHVPETRSFLITYIPIFQEITASWILTWILGIAIMIVAAAYFLL